MIYLRNFPCRKFWCIWIVNKDKNFHNVPGLDVNLVSVSFMHFKFDFGEESSLPHSSHSKSQSTRLTWWYILSYRVLKRLCFILKLSNKILRFITLLSSSKLNTWHTNFKFFKIKATSSIFILNNKNNKTKFCSQIDNSDRGCKYDCELYFFWECNLPIFFNTNCSHLKNRHTQIAPHPGAWLLSVSVSLQHFQCPQEILHIRLFLARNKYFP